MPHPTLTHKKVITTIVDFYRWNENALLQFILSDCYTKDGKKITKQAIANVLGVTKQAVGQHIKGISDAK